ncbi:MAG: hypothetical protein J0M07_25785 [Anaerolineae bacterium]|nr:hypothetical protein [Anaerolineae bacterium]
MPDDIKIKKYEEVLMAALDFDEDDLAANERGSYSERQIATLHHQRSRQLRRTVLMCAVVIVMAAFVAFVWPLAAIPMLLLVLLFLLMATLNGGQALRRLARDVRDSVAAVEGRIELDARSAENGGDYFVQMDAYKFKVQREAFFAFKNRDPYRLYYAPNTKTILSVEWLRADPPFTEADQLDLEADPRPQITRMTAGTQVSPAGAAKR